MHVYMIYIQSVINFLKFIYVNFFFGNKEVHVDMSSGGTSTDKASQDDCRPTKGLSLSF